MWHEAALSIRCQQIHVMRQVLISLLTDNQLHGIILYSPLLTAVNDAAEALHVLP
jgi:5,10-methylene-tetrahydrofolate dehydrogenase/methenyl tetrahydrofolate cyclohydrolase